MSLPQIKKSESSYKVREIKKALIYKVKTSEKGHKSTFRSKWAKLMKFLCSSGN